MAHWFARLQDGIGRWHRRLHRRLPWRSDSRVEYVYSRRYGADLMFPVADLRRGQRVLSFLDREGILQRGHLHGARRVSLRKLLRVHDATYLESLESREGLSRVLGFDVPAADVDEILLVQRAMVGGTVLAGRLALRDRKILVNLGGGLHHAKRDRGQGFCLFNDIAVSIVHLRERGFDGRILVVDLDLHDGEGTRSLFADDPTVHTYSIHNVQLEEDTAVASTSIALGSEVEDETYLSALTETLPPLVDRFEPQLVYFVAGADPAYDDRLGDWHISAQAMFERDSIVFDCSRPRGSDRPVVMTLAGGYGHHSWRYTARTLAWLATGVPLEPPQTADLPITEYRRLARHLSEPVFLAEPDREDDWGLSADDLPGPSAMGDRRLFGRYTVHGVELALERMGFLRQVRALGHPHIKLEADLAGPLGQTLRLVSLQPERRTLFELRGRKDERLVPGFTVLFVEWLLSQNPGAEFPVHRPGLEGQEHPGTGLLKDIVSLLLLACEKLGLDGLAFVPAQPSLALQAASVAQPVDPVAAGRFRALLRAVGDLGFLEAVKAIEEGQVVDAQGRPFVWEPIALAIPVSDRMRAFFERSEYLRDRDAAAAAHRLQRSGPAHSG